MYSLYNFFLHRKWSGPFYGKAFRLGLATRRALHGLRDRLGYVFAPAPPLAGPPPRGSLRRILIVRTDRIGDIVLSTPALRALREALPDAEIDLVVQEKYASLLEAYPGWNRLFTLKDRDSREEARALAPILRERRYDAAIVGNTAASSYRLARMAGVPIRVGWRAKGYGHSLSAGFPDDRATADRHEVENDLKLLEPLGIVAKAGEEPRFPTRETESGRKQLEAFLAAEGLSPREPLLVIHPGSFSPRVRWGLEKFAEVAGRAMQEGIRVVLLGSGAEAALVEEVWRQSGEKAAAANKAAKPASPIKAVDRFDLQGLVSFLGHARVFVGNSTGPMHIAASAGAWTLAIFGSRYGLDRHELWRPYGPKGVVIEAAGVKCCALPWTCADMPCLGNISAAQVWEAVREAWSAADRAGSGPAAGAARADASRAESGKAPDSGRSGPAPGRHG
jgi:ADP-heptose:LPS heptosyltransferase